MATSVDKSGIALGQDVGQKLIELLCLPEGTTGFTLRCYMDEIVTVQCDFAPDCSKLRTPRITSNPTETE